MNKIIIFLLRKAINILAVFLEKRLMFQAILGKCPASEKDRNLEIGEDI